MTAQPIDQHGELGREHGWAIANSVKIAGRHIWITGASSGIGRALAIHMSQSAGALLLTSRRQDVLEEVAAECSANCTVHVLALDQADLESHEASVGAALHLIKQIDMVVWNAGVSQRSLATDTALEVDQRIMQVNYLGIISLTKLMLPHLLSRPTSQIVVVSSLVGKFGSPYRSSYAASKHALHGFFDSLRAELHEESMQITILCPGFIRTDISRHALTADGSELGTMDKRTDKGMAPAVMAQKATRKIIAGRREAAIGGTEVLALWIKRLSPALLARLITRARVR